MNDEQRALVEAHAEWAADLARWFRRPSDDDLIGAALLELCVAATKHPPGSGDFRGFARVAITNRLRMEMRSEGRRASHVERDVTPLDPGPEPVADFADLTPDERFVLHERFVAGVSRRELAASQGVTPHAIRQIEQAALEKLR